MLLIPAIDLKDGHCVRLKQGDMEQSTTFGEDPPVMARSWVTKGARRLHLVDLNGAYAGHPKNEVAIRRILKDVGSEVKLQGFWGGSLGKDPFKQFELLKNGVADVAWVLPGYTPGQFNKTFHV